MASEIKFKGKRLWDNRTKWFSQVPETILNEHLWQMAKKKHLIQQSKERK
jgi:hypothetical protein